MSITVFITILRQAVWEEEWDRWTDIWLFYTHTHTHTHMHRGNKSLRLHSLHTP